MSFADISKPNKQKRINGYFNNIKAGSLELDLSCNVPEINLQQLKLTNPLTENKTTLKTVGEEDYDFIFPANQATENSLLTINENGELNFLPSSSLPTIGGDIVCNSLQSNTFVNSDTIQASQITSLNQVETTNLRLNGSANGQTILLCQDTDNSLGDSIKFPNTAPPQEPAVEMCLTVKSAVDNLSGFSVDTVWKYPKRAFTSGTELPITVNPAVVYNTPQVQNTIFGITLGNFLDAGKSYRILITQIQIKKESGGTNQDYFIIEAQILADDAFRLSKKTAISGMGNGTNQEIYELINQTDITEFVNLSSPNNALAYTQPIELIVENILGSETFFLKIGNGYFGAVGWSSWSVQSVQVVAYEL
jgi:hypothetical protein